MNKEIGLEKAGRFFFFSIVEMMLHVSLPPVRVWLLRLLGARVGKDCVILNCSFSNAYHYGFNKLIIGDRCFIGDEVMIDLRGGVIMEDWVTVSNRVSLVTHMNVGYRGHPLQKAYPTKESSITLRRGCFIGTAAIILPGVSVGKESVVGAGAVVTRSVLDNRIVVGVPAKSVRKSDKNYSNSNARACEIE